MHGRRPTTRGRRPADDHGWRTAPQVDNVIAAVELRTDPTQCNFQPQLNPATPPTCGDGYRGQVRRFLGGLRGRAHRLDGQHPGTGVRRAASPCRGRPRPTCRRTTCRPVALGRRSGPAPDKGQCTGAAGDFSSVSYLDQPRPSPSVTSGTTLPDSAAARRSPTTSRTGARFRRRHGADPARTAAAPGTPSQPAAATCSTSRLTLATLAPSSTNPLRGRAGLHGHRRRRRSSADWGTSIIDLARASVGVGSRRHHQRPVRHRPRRLWRCVRLVGRQRQGDHVCGRRDGERLRDARPGALDLRVGELGERDRGRRQRNPDRCR